MGTIFFLSVNCEILRDCQRNVQFVVRKEVKILLMFTKQHTIKQPLQEQITFGRTLFNKV